MRLLFIEGFDVRCIFFAQFIQLYLRTKQIELAQMNV